MKQITIYDLLPLLQDGYVAMDEDGTWKWFDDIPHILESFWYLDYPHREFIHLSDAFKELAPFDGDWKDSLIKIDHFHQQGKMVKEEE